MISCVGYYLVTTVVIVLCAALWLMTFAFKWALKIKFI